MSSITWPFSPFYTVHAISYRCPIVTKSLSRAVFEITGLKDIEIATFYVLSSAHKPFQQTTRTERLQTSVLVSPWSVHLKIQPLWQCTHISGLLGRQINTNSSVQFGFNEINSQVLFHCSYQCYKIATQSRSHNRGLNVYVIVTAVINELKMTFVASMDVYTIQH